MVEVCIKGLPKLDLYAPHINHQIVWCRVILIDIKMLMIAKTVYILLNKSLARISFSWIRNDFLRL